ncbi:Tad domain-containing protein [Desulfofalx alkaliphila]|uniref:Tad domain-containing protein n=1 Tax=Desulfofalx alkaliphila TaxID=105483 RepID=UPI0004E120ED|nr:Tad domain-containing protein [Desulfofalx alkaliphila]
MSKKNLLNDERGSILPITAAVIFIFLALIAVVTDFGRANIAKEKLQVASDAASLAGAKSVDRYVRLEIDPGSRKSSCCDESGCSPCCVDCGDPFTVVGKEADLLDNNGWQNYCCSCGCNGMKILDRWVNYKNNGADVYMAANTLFEINRPKEMDISTGGSAFITVNASYLRDTNRGNPYYPSVIVRAQGKVKTVMMDVFKTIAPDTDFSYIETSTCSQGRTYYRDLSTGKWSRPPSSYCNE